MDNVYYQANWWIQGDEPVPASELTNIWDSRWEEVDPWPTHAIALPDSGSESGAGGSGGIDKVLAPIVAVTERDHDSEHRQTAGRGIFGLLGKIFAGNIRGLGYGGLAVD